MIKKKINLFLPIGFVIFLTAALNEQPNNIFFIPGILIFTAPFFGVYLILVKIVPFRFFNLIQRILGVLLIFVNLFLANGQMSFTGLAARNRQPNLFAFALSIYTIFFIYFIFKQEEKDLYTYFTVPVLFVTTVILFFLSF